MELYSAFIENRLNWVAVIVRQSWHVFFEPQCSDFIMTHPQSAQAWITQFYLQITACLPLPRSPDGATTNCGCRHLIAAYCSFIDPERMKG